MKQLDINNIEIVTTTDYSKKLTIDGVTESYPVYRIKLECLYYNDQNDRIATWLSKFKSDHPDFGVDSPDYNDVIRHSGAVTCEAMHFHLRSIHG